MEDLFWGNLYEKQVKTASTITDKYKSVADYFSSDEYIFPTLEETEKEIETLIKLVAQESKAKSKPYFDMDVDLFSYFEKEAKKLGIKSRDSKLAIKFLASNISPLTLNLKRYWNRARPYQYGYLLDLPIHPIKTKSGANTPCYPSGHSLQAIAFNKILSAKYPDKSAKLDEIENQIHQSRLSMGVHFPSDINFSIAIGEYMSLNNMWM